MRMRAKPVTVTAVQWTGENILELRELVGDTKLDQEDGKTFVYDQGEKTPLNPGDVVFLNPNDEADVRHCPREELAERFERVCGLCDQPSDKFFTIPEALDERKHGICTNCEMQGLEVHSNEGTSE